MEKLYKKDSKGKIRILELSTEGSLFVQTSGLLDGKLVRHEKECKPKNVGKSNATTAKEQAEVELQAKKVIKLSEGYYSTKDEAETEEVLMPMLAKVYEEHFHKIDWENDDVYVQPKLDGMRCLAVIKDNKVTLLSRKNKPIETMDHIKLDLEDIDFSNLDHDIDSCILDGELYAHGKTFQENMKLIKKYRKGESEKVKFHVYDIVDDSGYWNRSEILMDFYASIEFNHLLFVDSYEIKGEKDLKEYHAKFLKEGYEGTMIRWGDASYKVNGRSENLLKYKDFQDIACEIIDIEPAEQRPEWGVPVLKYTNKKLTGTNEVIFRAGTKMSHDERKDLLQNKGNFIGKTAEIRFFEWTDEGVPRFPVMYGIRLDR